MNKIHSCLAAMAAMLLLAPAANAVPTLSLSDGTTTVTCADGITDCDINYLDGAVTYLGKVGDFTLNVTTGITKPLKTDPLIDLNSVNLTAVSGGFLTIMFSEVGFGGSGGSVMGSFGGTLLAPSGSYVSSTAFFDIGNGGNNLFGMTTPIGSSLTFNSTPFSGTFSGPGPGLGTPYSLTQVLNISFTGPGTFSGDFDLRAVPEPASLALLGIGLIGLGFARRKRA